MIPITEYRTVIYLVGSKSFARVIPNHSLFEGTCYLATGQDDERSKPS